MLIALIIFIALLLLRVPIAFVLGITTVFYIIISGNMGLLDTAPQRLYSGLESYGLLAIPLFMMAGELMNSGGITKRLIDFAKTIIGHYRGGLAYVNVLANMMLASIIGSATAQIAMMSRIMVPAMEKAGYSKSFSSATTAAAGLLGPIIPPSMMFIIYGVTSGASIGQMFLAGVLPGILLGIGFILCIAFIGFKQQWTSSERASASEMMTNFLKVLPALLVPAIIIIGILSGVFTATESAAIACAVALVVGALFYRELQVKDFPQIMINTAITTATITMLIAMANLFGWSITFERIPQSLAEWMVSITENPLLFLLIVNLFLLLVGMVLDGIAALIILVPIFMPIIAQFGIDPIHFGVIICFNLALGLLTPPIGTGLFIASSIGKVKIETLTRAIWPFLGVAIVVLIIITYFPQLVLWLPSLWF
ncbi:TRAP transporter large permease [Alkalihalobacillus sp. 1P02AB]|uniref:TRAP transporter large permease n=1 Tax=Alkalihalobacillus sp. 1P02AB TaxID=3132260 RepID=UPI0039A74747